MRFTKSLLCCFVLISLFCTLNAQQAAPAAGNAVVPPVIKYNGALTDVDNKPLTGIVGVTFSLYQEAQDAWANAHRIPVEVEKAQADRGFYLHPELFGAPPEKSIALAHHPMMQKLLKQQAAAKLNVSAKQ
jgi:hypothetical protein